MQTQQTGGFAFSSPGMATGDPDDFGGYQVQDKPRTKYGILPMQADYRFNIPFARGKRTKVEQVTCNDRRRFHRARVRLYCMHPGCVGKSWADMKELADGHRSPVELERDREAHLVFAWSEDPVNLPDEACVDCRKTTKEASAKATASAREKVKDAAEVETPMPCAKHAGGVVGLLTPHDPNVPS
jgi:hypothetical protein